MSRHGAGEEMWYAHYDEGRHEGKCEEGDCRARPRMEMRRHCWGGFANALFRPCYGSSQKSVDVMRCTWGGT